MPKKRTAIPELGAMPSDLKPRNRQAVFQVFRELPECTVADIALKTGISRQTVIKAVQFFLEKGLVKKVGKGESSESGGKKPDLYRIEDTSLLLSITMWPNTLHFNLMNLQGEVLATEETETPRFPGAAMAYADLTERLVEFLLRNNAEKDSLYGVALSTPGIIDYKTGTIMYNAQDPSWGYNIPAEQFLRNILGEKIVVIIENAGKTTGRAATLEKSFEEKRIAVLFTTWGLSACFIQTGYIHAGVNSLIGEIGHMTINPAEEEECGCGGYGCFEQMIRIERVRQRLLKEPEKRRNSLLGKYKPDKLTIPILFDASRDGDPFAREIVKELARYYAIGLRNITLNFDPDLVVFQGDYAHADDYFCLEVINLLSTFHYSPDKAPFTLKFDKRSIFDLDVIGAAKCLIDHYYENSSHYED